MPRGQRWRRFEPGKIEPKVLPKKVGGHQVGFAAPLHDVHDVGVRQRITPSGAELQTIPHAGGEVMPFDGLEVDWLAGEVLVAGVDLGEVTEVQQRVAHPPDRQVFERVANMAEFQIDDRHQVPVVVHELAGIPHACRQPTVRLRHMP